MGILEASENNTNRAFELFVIFSKQILISKSINQKKSQKIVKNKKSSVASFVDEMDDGQFREGLNSIYRLGLILLGQATYGQYLIYVKRLEDAIQAYKFVLNLTNKYFRLFPTKTGTDFVKTSYEEALYQIPFIYFDLGFLFPFFFLFFFIC